MDTKELQTDLMNKMTIRAENKENHFRRLPDELVVSIFNRVAVVKCLFHCSLVSKHFASLISRVQTVSVTVVGSMNNDEEYLKRLNIFMNDFMDSSGKQIHALLDSLSLQNMKLPVFLDKLTELKCICLDYDCPKKSLNFPSPMCKIKFYRNGAKFESFVALVPHYMRKDTEDEGGEEEGTRYLNAATDRAMECWWQVYMRYWEWVCHLFMLIKHHPSLKRVTITDSEIHGKLVVGDEQGINLERGVRELLDHFSGPPVRFGCVPVLHLPLSGYVMRCVAMVIVDLPENSCAPKSLNEIEFWDFDDELPVFREAVKEFLKNHKDKLIILEL